MFNQKQKELINVYNILKILYETVMSMHNLYIEVNEELLPNAICKGQICSFQISTVSTYMGVPTFRNFLMV